MPSNRLTPIIQLELGTPVDDAEGPAFSLSRRRPLDSLFDECCGEIVDLGGDSFVLEIGITCFFDAAKR